MIAIVLAGGYAKRLWPLTTEIPKSLLLIKGKPIIDHIIEKLNHLDSYIDKIILSTNLKFQKQFEQWLETKKNLPIELIPDKTKKEEKKLGAIKALENITSTIDQKDLLVLAGDSLFDDNLVEFIKFFHEKKAPIIALYHTKDKDEYYRSATVVVDKNNRIVNFTEKPINPNSTILGACIYAFPSGINARLKKYTSLGLSNDEPGRFIEWLYRQEPVYGYILNNKLLDIGTPGSYQCAEKFFTD